MNASQRLPSSSLAFASIFAATALVAACSAGAGGSEDAQKTSEQSLAEACGAPAYVAGKVYGAGDAVTVSGAAYACKPYPYSGWCGLGGAYAPGTGSSWQDAWSAVGSCAGGGGAGGGASPCNATAWQAGKAYVTGDVVTFQGSDYVATHDNPGYDPTISTWFWSRTSKCAAPAPSPSPGGGGGGTASCGASAWQAGRSYRTGDVVAFGGRTFIATHDNPGYDPTISTWFWDPYACSGSTTPPPAPPPPPAPGTGGTAFERLISRGTFESMFPGRNAFYTYDGLVEATKKYPAFASSGSADDQKREVAGFLANVSHETGGLVYVEEIAKADYCESAAPGCPCAPGKRYFGRGPLQLSWNYNYCAASQSIFGSGEVLRTDPDRVAREAWVAWATGLFFWMTSTGAGTMTSHDAMTNGSNFGETIRTINGGLECGGRNPGAVQSRVDAYRRFSQMLGVDPGGRTTC